MLSRNTVCFKQAKVRKIAGGVCHITAEQVPLYLFEFEVKIPESFLDNPDKLGWCHVPDLWLYCAVNGNDNTEVWYGFAKWEQRSLFLLLKEADGVGPASAFKLLNANDWGVIDNLIEVGDQDGFKKLKGIGPKTADKLIPIVFKDKPKPTTQKFPPRTAEQLQRNEDAVSALVALGHKKVTASLKVTEAQARMGMDTPVEHLIKAALRT